MTSDQVAALRQLLEAHTRQQPTPVSAHTPGRPELTAATLGSQVILPAGTVLWRHSTPSSRELHRVAYAGGPLIVHNVEPAGASFLATTEDSEPSVRRGPALTLRAAGQDDDDLFVLFGTDLPTT